MGLCRNTRGSLPVAACISGRAHVCGCFRTQAGVYFPVSDVSRPLSHALLTVCVRVSRGGAPDGHDVEFFARREYHSDIQTVCYTKIYAIAIAIRATVRPRRGERTKEIYGRIS